MKNSQLTPQKFVSKFQKLPGAQKIRVGAVIGISIVLVTLVVVLLANRNNPERSVASFCSYLKANQVPGDWKADVAYYKELEARAPKDIYQQTKTIRQTYEEMVRHPEAAVGLDLSIAGTGNQFNEWVSTNCYPSSSTDPAKSLQQWKQDFQKSLNED